MNTAWMVLTQFMVRTYNDYERQECINFVNHVKTNMKYMVLDIGQIDATSGALST